MINTEIIHTDIIDTEDVNKRLVEAELKVWRKVEDIAYAEGKHHDEVYVDLMLQFSEFIERNTPLRSTLMRNQQKNKKRK
jgi:hypothetical protein